MIGQALHLADGLAAGPAVGTGHKIKRRVENGALKDYAEATRRLELSRARRIQVLNIFLPPRMPETILAGKTPDSEHDLWTG